MCTQIFNCVRYCDLFFVFLGAVLSGVVTVILIQFFKPKICFELPFIVPKGEKKILKLPVINLSKFFAAINLRTELAVVLDEFTYHFDLDRQDFIMLSKNKPCNKEKPYIRTYQAHEVAVFTKIVSSCETIDDLINLLKSENAYLRVRVHAYHEFSGFGKVFQKKFTYKNEKFTVKSNVKTQHKKLCLSAVFIVYLSMAIANAQETIPASGSEALGSGGSASYTAGQVVYNINTASTGSVAQGIQQPFEISVISGIERASEINLQYSAYPNPTTDFLILKTNIETKMQTIASLYDINGKLIMNKKIESNETRIELSNQPPATYFLKITQVRDLAKTQLQNPESGEEIKTFKIIKIK